MLRIPLRSFAPRQAIQPFATKPFAARLYSSEAPKPAATEKSPKETAEALINLFPGDSLAAKSGSALLAASVASYLISKEIYILDGEVFEMACIFGAYYVWYSGGKEGFKEYFAERTSVRPDGLTVS